SKMKGEKAMFEEIMARMRSAYSPSVKDNPAVAAWRGQGKPVFGYMCNNVPEEILAAAGVLPVKLLGAPINIAEANQYHSTFMCHYGRSILELALNGDYEALGGLVYAFGCDGGCNISQVLMETVPVSYYRFIYLPHNDQGDAALKFYLHELEAVYHSLEDYLGLRFGEQELRKEIKIFNKNRDLLRQIYELRGGNPVPALTGVEVAEILEYNVSVPREEGNELLTEIIGESSSRQLNEYSSRPRLLVAGTILPDTELYQMVEDAGGIVVGDSLCQGSRYFWDPVNEQLPPLEALAVRMLSRIPCSCVSWEKVAERQIDHLVFQAERYRAHGVIFAVQKWCDPMQMDRPFMIEQLQQKGIPVLSIEVERTAGGSQFRNRLEAFMEMLVANSGGGGMR
ncbi:MAG: 2-hydroxyacyl-CoA dehydratase subunit D, partial [Bacillota bacterium]